jgi:Zn-dependent protease with chaperone function
MGGAETPYSNASIWVLPGRAPVLALAGIFRSRIVASEAVLATLTSEQLDAALRHERSHRISHDNLKRLAMLLVPSGMLPFHRSFVALENAWARCAEWVADDRASGADPRHAVALAEALMRVSRLPASPAPPILVITLAGDHHDVALRIDRLLHSSQVDCGRTPRTDIWLWCGGALTSLAVLGPGVLRAVHKLLETLMR